jgi:hypothetical protein
MKIKELVWEETDSDGWMAASHSLKLVYVILRIVNGFHLNVYDHGVKFLICKENYESFEEAKKYAQEDFVSRVSKLAARNNSLSESLKECFHEEENNKIKQLVWEEIDRGFDNSWKAEMPTIGFRFYILKQGCEFTLEICKLNIFYEVNEVLCFDSFEKCSDLANEKCTNHIKNILVEIKQKEEWCKRQKEAIEYCL